jgi:hypothetical protein
LNEAHEIIWTKMKGHQEERNDKFSGAKSLIEEKKALSAKISDIFKKRDEIWDHFKKQKKNFNEWEREQRQAQVGRVYEILGCDRKKQNMYCY